MSIDKSILKHVGDIDVSSHELMINAVLNRNFRKLFENNTRLLSDSMDVYNGMYRVLPYERGKVYNKNDLVWFVSFYLSPKKEKEYNDEYAVLTENPNYTSEEVDELKNKYYTTTLYLLRSLKNNNDSFPQMTMVDMIPMFDASGWKNENPAGSIYTDYFEEFTANNLKEQLYNMHEASKVWHKFGMLSSYTELDKSVLLTNLTNIDPDREHIFFPNITTDIDPDDTIVNGSMRKWDCGLLEYDIIFKLGNSKSTISKYNPDGSLKTSEELEANYFDMKNENYGGSIYSEYDNRKYYLNDSDSDIFKIDGGKDIVANGLTQKNINSVLNSYLGTIKFPVSFIDLNYAIFQTNIPSSIYEETDEDIVQFQPNVNNMVFVNKSMESITALLVIPNYESSLTKVLGNNRFRCQITGRWK